MAPADDAATSGEEDAGAVDEPDGGGGADGAPDSAVDAAACTDTAVLFLATEGITLTQGFEDATTNRSSLIEGTRAIGAYYGGEPGREALIDAIVAQVESVVAPYDVRVTRTRPASGPYRMIVLGESAAQAGFSQTTFAMVPGACTSIEDAIGFVFETGIDTEVELASTLIVAELGLLAGVPSTNQAGDCLCFNGPACDFATPCTLGGEGTPTQANGCEEPATIDPQAAFADTFPCD